MLYVKEHSQSCFSYALFMEERRKAVWCKRHTKHRGIYLKKLISDRKLVVSKLYLCVPQKCITLPHNNNNKKTNWTMNFPPSSALFSTKNANCQGNFPSFNFLDRKVLWWNFINIINQGYISKKKKKKWRKKRNSNGLFIRKTNHVSC